MFCIGEQKDLIFECFAREIKRKIIYLLYNRTNTSKKTGLETTTSNNMVNFYEHKGIKELFALGMDASAWWIP